METGGITNTTGNQANVFSTKEAQFGDNPFLQLLVAEMRSQTPLDPVDNASFMNQMAQFSSMEQQKELNENMLALLQFQGALARLNGLSQGSAMIGKEVEYVIDEKGTKRKGTVEGVSVDENGGVNVTIGGKSYSLGAIISILGSEESKAPSKKTES